jgi:hypothetical protein
LVHGASVADGLICPTPPSAREMMQLDFACSARSWNSFGPNQAHPPGIAASIL